LLDVEGANLAEPDWLGMLEGIGSAADRPFKPDDRTRAILDGGGQDGVSTGCSIERQLSAGAPEEIRTPDPQIRSLVLYPAELRALAPGT
jgi:hypothetical protein